MKLNKLRKNLLFSALGVFLMSCVFFCYSFFGNSAQAFTAVSTTTITDPLYDFNDYCYSQSALDELSRVLLNNNSYNFNSLINYATNVAGTDGEPMTSSKKEVTLKYGRYRFTPESIYRDLIWTPVYLSKSRTGDAILTLYLATTVTDASTSGQEFSAFSSYHTFTSDVSCSMPSNSYGTSAMRASVLGNGGTYAYYSNPNTASATSYTATIKESECNKFSDFIKMTGKDSEGKDKEVLGVLYDDLATPSEIVWQETESYKDANYFDDANSHYSLLNEAYGTPSPKDYYLPGYFDYNDRSKVNYNLWKDDKVWLPSVTEVGNGDILGDGTNTTNGIWELTKAQRSNSMKSWLRSACTEISKDGNNYSAYTMYCTAADGTITTADVSEINVAVRPAIHLNLSKIASKTIAPIRLPDKVSTTYNGQAQTITDVAEDDRKWYSPNEMIVTFFANEELTRMVSPIDSGTYVMLVQLQNTDRYFFGEDKNTRLKTTKFVVEKKKIEVEFEYGMDGTVTIPERAVIKDYDNVIYERDINAGFAPEVGLKYSNIAGILLKNPYEFPDIKGTYIATAYIKNEDIYNYNYQLSGAVDSNQFRVNERNIPEPYFIADTLVDEEELSDDKMSLTLKYQGKRYIQIANISSYVKIVVNSSKKGAEAKECILRDDGVMVYEVEACADYTFTVSLVDTINTQWAKSVEAGQKDTIPKTLNLRLNQAVLTVKFSDSLPASWESARTMTVELEITGIYDELDANLISVYYYRQGMNRVYLTRNADGTYTIPRGLNAGSAYTLVAVMEGDNQITSNYRLIAAVTQNFEIVSTKPTFNDSDAIWTYKIDGVPPSPMPNIGFNQHDSPSNPLKLPYGGTYEFSLGVTEAVLETRYLRAIYSGDTYVTESGLHSVTVLITAFDKYVEFTNKTYTIYFEIAKTTYDLAGIKWNYTTPFVYDGTEHKVMLDPSTPLPAGLTATYTTSGAVGNGATNGGTYTTQVSFIVSEEYASNYIVPVMGDTDTYRVSSGSFSFTLTWTIVQQTIEVEWTEDSSSSNIFFIPTLVNGHSFVDYTYERNNGGTWTPVTSISAPTGADEEYRVKPVIKSDYEQNYTLSGDDWHTFTLKSGKKPVTIHIEINGKTNNDGDKYVYTGSAYEAKPVVDTTGINMTGFIVEYYNMTSSGTRGSKLSEAPVNAGKYIAVVTEVKFDDAYLSNSENETKFEIIKADFDMSTVKWKYAHNGTIIFAGYDPEQGKWVNSDGEEVIFSFEYDGTEHKLELVGYDNIDGLSINNLYDTGYTDAGDNYSSGVSFNFDSANYNNPVPSLFPGTVNWTIKKATIHFDNVKWGYIDKEGKEHEFDFENDKFTFTIDEDGFVYYEVALINLPEGVSSQLSYKSLDLQKPGATYEGNKNKYARVGKYRTDLTSRTIVYAGDANTEAYTGALPNAIPSFCLWEIGSRELTAPSYDGSWIEYDAKVHNLVDLCNIPEDEIFYYNIKIMFVDPSYNIDEDYPGYTEIDTAGPVKYTARDAGTYTVRFFEIQLDSEDKVVETLKWQEVIEVGRETLVVVWDENGSIPVARVSGVYVTDILETVYTNENGGEVTKEYIQNTDGVTFYAEPRISSKYNNNLTFVMAEGLDRKLKFESSQYKYEEGRSQPLTPPSMLAKEKEYTGKPLTFEIASWYALYDKYLYVSGDDLTQTEIGVYTVTISFKKYDPLTGEGDAYWSGTDGNRSSIELEFEITEPSSYPIDRPIFDETIANETGSMIEFKITNWVVIQNYIYYELSDGLTEIRPGVVGAKTPGIYTITFKFKEDSKGCWADDGSHGDWSVDLTISGADEYASQIAKPVISNSTRPWTGNPIGFSIDNYKYYEKYLELTSGEWTQTNPGTYTVVLTIKDGIPTTFSDGTKSVKLTYTITPPSDPGAAVKLEHPVFEESSLKYTGGSLEFKIKDWDNLSLFLEITSGSLIKTEIGTYKIILSFKEGSKATWSDGSTDPYEMTFYITGGDTPVEPGTVPELSFENPELQFTGKPIVFVINGYIDNYDKLVQIKEGFGYLAQTGIGEYKICLQIIDKTTTTWWDGTTDDKYLTFRIIPAVCDPDSAQVNGNGSLELDNGNGEKVNLDDFLEYVYIDKDGNVVAKEDLKDGEEYTVTIRVKPDKLEEFNKVITNADEVRERIEKSSYTFIYNSGSGGVTPILIITVSIVVVLILLVIATIIVLAVKRRQYVEEDESDAYYDDYEEDD